MRRATHTFFFFLFHVLIFPDTRRYKGSDVNRLNYEFSIQPVIIYTFIMEVTVSEKETVGEKKKKVTALFLASVVLHSLQPSHTHSRAAEHTQHARALLVFALSYTVYFPVCAFPAKHLRSYTCASWRARAKGQKSVPGNRPLGFFFPLFETTHKKVALCVCVCVRLGGARPSGEVVQDAHKYCSPSLRERKCFASVFERKRRT